MPTEHPQNATRMLTEYPQNTHTIVTEYIQNTHRISTEYPQNTYRTPTAHNAAASFACRIIGSKKVSHFLCEVNVVGGPKLCGTCGAM